MSESTWDDDPYPLAYLITFCTYGTWLHGDRRGSVDRHERNIYGTEKIGLDPVFSVKMEQNLAAESLLLDGPMRSIISASIRNVCTIRDYGLSALNVRTNHVHVVVSAERPPKSIMNAFKANATRELRDAGLIEPDQRVWSRGGSTRYLWKPRNVEAAADYTLNGQGDDLPDF